MVPTMSSTMMKTQAMEKFQWNQSRYQRLAPRTRQVEVCFHNRQKRSTYSATEMPPRQPVLMEKTALGERSVR